jgi:hypothetical protein
MPSLLQIAIIAIAGFLAAIGVALLLKGERLLETFAHRREALVRVFGGRYLAMAGMLVALSALQEWRALAIVVGIGGAMGLLDAWLVGRVGGQVWPHLLAAAVCLALAAAALV